MYRYVKVNANEVTIIAPRRVGGWRYVGKITLSGELLDADDQRGAALALADYINKPALRDDLIILGKLVKELPILSKKVVELPAVKISRRK